jgi:hypothetical protein
MAGLRKACGVMAASLLHLAECRSKFLSEFASY